MTAKIDIWNKALINAASFKNPVSAETERSREVQVLSRAHDSALRSALRAHDWNFARQSKAGALLQITPSGSWTAAYGYPPDCIAVRRIEKDFPQENAPEFEIRQQPGNTGQKMILTKRSPVVIVYTAYATEPSHYDDQFIEALSWILAADICGPLTKDLRRADYCRKMAAQVIDAAQVSNRNEGGVDPVGRDAEWIEGR